MGRRSYDLSSSAMDRRDSRHSSFISNNRIAILVAVVLVAGAVIAGIVVAVYFTNIPSQSKSDATSRIEISKMKAFQGEVRMEQEWNEDLKDLNSDLSKEKVHNFTSAMEAVCRNISGYNYTVVHGFRNGSIVVSYRMIWVAKYIAEIDTSAAVIENGQQGHVVSEMEINPVDIVQLAKLLQDELPKYIGTVVIHVSDLEEVNVSTQAASSTTVPIPKPMTTDTLASPTTTSFTVSPDPNTSTKHGLMTTPNQCQDDAVTLTCHFEDSCLCGYRNDGNVTLWYQRSGHFFKLPRYDHTYGSDTGQFMIVYNTSDLAEYYNALKLKQNISSFPSRLQYSHSTLISPRVNFTTESCVYFYYYLNGTAVRPNPLSAQLFVYVNDNNGRRLAWYDHINRTVSDWLKGWVPVQSGFSEVTFVAKTITTTTIWPGVVALDDVSVIHSPCPASPNCGHDTFQCNTTSVCISVYLQCDGNNDCLDGSDEETCIRKPDYQVKLINGDGSYGSIGIFYQGLWRPVCMSKYSLTAGNISIVQLTCKHIGYTGRYQGTFVNSWHQPVQNAVEISCNSYSADISNCSMYITQTNENTSSCYYYQAAICSNDECFSGERICPLDYTYSNYSSAIKCVSHKYFCDGIHDCPRDTDELNCANCSASEFECTNHECIPLSHRCDGTQHCGDRSDEYGCVIIANNISQIYYSQLSAYLPVCYDGINNTLANILCSLCGEGISRQYQRHEYVPEGTMLVPQANSTTSSLVPGYAVSIGPCTSALIQCSSFECGTTVFDNSRLGKVLFGRDALLGQLPWHIGVYINGECCCGGSIIHPNWVITAAHCTTYNDSYTIIAGAVEVESPKAIGYEGQLYNSSRLHKNPLYNSQYDNDNSLLYFNQPIVFSDYVRPICIASRITVEEMIKAGFNTECYISGWGLTQNVINRVMWLGKLQMVRVYLYNKDKCNQIYHDVFGTYPQNTTVCVDNQNLGSPACLNRHGSRKSIG